MAHTVHRRRRSRRLVGTSLAAAALLAPLLTACGSGGSPGNELNWYIGKQAGGWIERAADECSKGSNGAYAIKVQDLPARATDQREQLVRRLAAKDKSIDLIGLDVIWTAEFAAAGWIQPFPDSQRAALTDGVLQGPVDSATFEDKLYAAPYTSNTQLLWYRKDLQPEPAQTWAEVISQAAEKNLEVQVQGTRAESLTVWFNALLAGAGGEFVTGAGGEDATVSLEQEPTVAALTVMKDLAVSPAADPELSQLNEDTSRQAFEQGNSLYEVNYPFIYPSAKDSVGPEFQAKIGWARFPQTVAGEDSRPPLGGFNLGVSAYSTKADLAFQAAECIRGEDNQRFAAINGGNPPTLESLYSDAELRKSYPFADVLRESIDNAAPRPVTPAYNDLSLAVQTTLHPPKSIDPEKTAKELRDLVAKALKSEAVL